MKRAFVFGLILGSLGCGRSVQHDEYHLDYLVAGSSAAGLVRQVNKPEIKICMASDSNSLQHKDDVIHAVTQWTSAIGAVSAQPVAQLVSIVAETDPSCDGTVYVGIYQPAYTNMGNHPTVHIYYNGWYGSRTVTLHEFGHAFGLLDTYNGRGGSCQSGQPDSVMCWANYDVLQPDDIAGVQKVYQNVTSGK